MKNSLSSLRQIAVAISYVITIIGVVSINPAFAQSMTLKFGHIHAPSGPTGRGADLFAKKVTEYTNGRVKIQVFPSGQLGKLKSLFAASRSGAVDIALTPYPLLSDIVPSYSILTAGYVFESFSHQLAVLDHPNHGQAWSTQLKDKGGLEVLANYYFGARTLTTTKTEVRTPSDLNGLKIRAVGNPLSLATIRGLGANPTPLPLSELFQGLSQGIVDGQENPLPTIFNQNFFDVQKYLVLTRHQMIPIPFTINANSMSKIALNDQEAIRRAAKEAAKFMTDTVMAEEASLTATLKGKGMTVIGPDQGLDMVAFRTSVMAQVEELDGKEWPSGLLEKVKALASAN
jgi:tripartite ATP-independent transporter DctP family solute receptor